MKQINKIVYRPGRNKIDMVGSRANFFIFLTNMKVYVKLTWQWNKIKLIIYEPGRNKIDMIGSRANFIIISHPEIFADHHLQKKKRDGGRGIFLKKRFFCCW